VEKLRRGNSLDHHQGSPIKGSGRESLYVPKITWERLNTGAPIVDIPTFRTKELSEPTRLSEEDHKVLQGWVDEVWSSALKENELASDSTQSEKTGQP